VTVPYYGLDWSRDSRKPPDRVKTSAGSRPVDDEASDLLAEDRSLLGFEEGRPIMSPGNVAGRSRGTRAGDPAIRVVMAYVSRNTIPPAGLSSLLAEMGRVVAMLRSQRPIRGSIGTASPIKLSVLARK
jgi:hypothetical protein